MASKMTPVSIFHNIATRYARNMNYIDVLFQAPE